MIKLFLSLFLAAVSLAGCAANIPQSVNETPLTYISALNNGAAFAATPDGGAIAYSHRGLKLLDAASRQVKVLTTTPPDSLAWSADGRQLASATFLDETTSRVSVYSQEGALVDDYEIPAVLNGLKWTVQGDLLATGYLLKVYSFGSNLKQSLFKLADGQIAEIQLTDTTLKPVTSKMLSPVMSEILPVHFSSYGDELVFVRLHDPPEFPPYVALIYRNWQVGGERVLQKFTLQVLQIRAGHDEDELEVLSRDGLSLIRLWPVREKGGYDENPYRFVNGSLTQEGVELANWGQGAQFQLLSDGRYLLSVDNKLYLGTGLQPAKADNYNEKKLSLRRWRHEGLISNDDYYKMLKELN